MGLRGFPFRREREILLKPKNKKNKIKNEPRNYLQDFETKQNKTSDLRAAQVKPNITADSYRDWTVAFFEGHKYFESPLNKQVYLVDSSF